MLPAIKPKICTLHAWPSLRSRLEIQRSRRRAMQTSRRQQLQKEFGLLIERTLHKRQMH